MRQADPRHKTMHLDALSAIWANMHHSNEATSTYRFALATACSFAYGKLTTPDCSDAASQCYKGIRITPSAGLKPDRSIADNGIRSSMLLTHLSNSVKNNYG